MEHMEHILEQNGAQNGTHGTQDACLDKNVWTRKRCPALRRVGFVGTRAGKRYRARSRLYRSHILQVNTQWGELSPRSTQCTPLHRFGIESVL